MYVEGTLDLLGTAYHASFPQTGRSAKGSGYHGPEGYNLDTFPVCLKGRVTAKPVKTASLDHKHPFSAQAGVKAEPCDQPLGSKELDSCISTKPACPGALNSSRVFHALWAARLTPVCTVIACLCQGPPCTGHAETGSFILLRSILLGSCI